MSNSMGDRPERGTSKRAATMEKKGGGERVGGDKSQKARGRDHDRTKPTIWYIVRMANLRAYILGVTDVVGFQ